jgi:D-alanine-D-alanine ligase
MTCPIWTYDDKYSGKTNELCPGRFTDTESEELQRLARIIHETLGLSHYSRSDFIITSRGTYALETNTLPGLTSESILPKALAAVGCSYPNFIEHLLELALSEKRGMMA